jgi:uncharacterized RmlC-like cupin family protein
MTSLMMNILPTPDNMEITTPQHEVQETSIYVMVGIKIY